MVDVSKETADQIENRLSRVIRLARMEIYQTPYAFKEFAIDAFGQEVRSDALALVRDDACWSQLVPAEAQDEQFMLVRFHFPSGVDNSGFVGWLATRLKLEVGSGVLVVCGQNSRDGGVYDYWGVPIRVADQVKVVLKQMTSQ